MPALYHNAEHQCANDISTYAMAKKPILCRHRIGGGGGIRTPGGVAPTQPFQGCTIDHSDTPPVVVAPVRKLVPGAGLEPAHTHV